MRHWRKRKMHHHRKNWPGQRADQRKKIRVKFEKYLQGNEFLTIPESLEAVNAKVISLLTTDIKGLRLMGVSRESMEEALKSLRIMPKVMLSMVKWTRLVQSEVKPASQPETSSYM